MPDENLRKERESLNQGSGRRAPDDHPNPRKPNWGDVLDGIQSKRHPQPGGPPTGSL